MVRAAKRHDAHQDTPVGLADRRLLRSLAYVGGRWTAADDAAFLPVTDPADGAWIGEVARIGRAGSIAAVDAADAAFHPWSRMLPQERSAILRRWYDLMLANREDLAVIMTREQGKPISESRGEIDYAASFIEFYAEEAKRPNIESVTSHLHDAEVEVWREPVGVAALVTPWNFPCAMITRKAGAALAAGCTVVVHPSIDDAVFRARAGGTRRARRSARRRVQRRHRRCAGDRRRMDGGQARARAVLHRLDRGRQAACTDRAPTR